MRVKDPTPFRRGRMLKGWTQRQLAVLCNRSQNAIHLLESGQSNTVGEDFAMSLFRELQLGKYPFNLRLEDVFEDIPASVMPAVATSACTDPDEVSP